MPNLTLSRCEAESVGLRYKIVSQRSILPLAFDLKHQFKRSHQLQQLRNENKDRAAVEYLMIKLLEKLL